MRYLLPCFLAIALLGSANQLRAAVDMFLKIPAAPGESTDATHTGDIDVLSFNWGAANQSSVIAGGSSSFGLFQDMVITKKVDKSTPKLMLFVMNGQRQSTVTLFVRTRGANPAEYLKLTLTNVIISSIQPEGAAAADGLLESVALRFSKIRIDYYPINADGTLGAVVTANWDSQTNTGS